jgi:hypothetical protein
VFGFRTVMVSNWGFCGCSWVGVLVTILKWVEEVGIVADGRLVVGGEADCGGSFDRDGELLK